MVSVEEALKSIKQVAKELEVIETYLPKQLSEEEISVGLKEIITQVGAASMADVGKVMPLAMQKFAGKTDGKTISNLLKNLLG